jgi:uncharacterized protein (TIGR03435 family)
MRYDFSVVAPGFIPAHPAKAGKRSIAAIGILSFAAAAFAQGPQFEVASVKVSAPLPSGVMMFKMGSGINTKDPSRVEMNGVTLKSLIASAYGVKDYQVEGPGWLDSERYDVMAKVPEGQSGKEQVELMMQHLLAERFHLSLHRDSKQMNVYTLSVSKPEKIKEVDPTTLPEPPAPGSVPLPPPLPRPSPDGAMPKMAGGPMPAGAMRMMMTPTGRHVEGNVTISKLCDMMTNFLDRPVVDLTELKGMYSIDLTWTPTDSEKMGGKVGPAMAVAMGHGSGNDSPDNRIEAGDPGPTLAQALLNNYGLKLEAKKNPADILVIDRAEKVPTEN